MDRGLTTRSKRLPGAPGLTTRSKDEGLVAILLRARTLLGARGLITRSKDATRGSWPYYRSKEATLLLGSRSY